MGFLWKIPPGILGIWFFFPSIFPDFPRNSAKSFMANPARNVGNLGNLGLFPSIFPNFSAIFFFFLDKSSLECWKSQEFGEFLAENLAGNLGGKI